MSSGSSSLPPVQRNVLRGEVEDTGSVDSCLQYLDPRAGLCPHSMSFTLLRLALDCTSTRPRNRPTMENVSQLNTIQCSSIYFISIQFYFTELGKCENRDTNLTFRVKVQDRTVCLIFHWIRPESDLNQTWIRPESDLNQTWIRPESDLNQTWIRPESAENSCIL
jgi:hypothetical protein